MGSRRHKARGSRSKRRRDNKRRGKVFQLETLEPRILLSADPLHVLSDSYDETTDGLTAQRLALDFESLEIDGLDAEHDPFHDAADAGFQLFYLDIDGALDVVYDGPISIRDVEVSPFSAPRFLSGQEDAILQTLLESVDRAFEGSGVVFTTEVPLADDDYSTLYLGSSIRGFESYGDYIGLSEQVDAGNLDQTDDAFVFGGAFEAMLLDVASFGSSLAGFVAGEAYEALTDAASYAEALAEIVVHEAGHLLGLAHEHTIGAEADPLAEVAFRPSTHIEASSEVRRDVIDDGKVTIAGGEYDVHPRIVEALRKYPSFFFGGSVGPDGFPDLAFGQGEIHPNSTGLWIGHVLDAAWAVQGDTAAYSPEEQLQVLSWAYGFASHSVGDIWSHTLANEFTDGPFPDFADVLTDQQAAANALRHFIIEGYIEDATPGHDGIGEVDGDVQREQLPTGDISDDSSVTRELDAPRQFIFDTLLADLPDLVGQSEDALFDINVDVATRIAELNAGTASAELAQAFADAGVNLTGDLRVEAILPVDPGPVTAWRVQSDFRDFVLRENSQDASLQVSEREKSRGVVIDAFLALRQQLVDLRTALPAPDPGFDEPFAAEVDAILAAGDGLLRGDDIDVDALFDELVDLGQVLLESFDPLFATIADAELPDAADVMAFVDSIAASLGTTASSYLNYWIDNIDEGLENWSQLGLAVSRGLFDPEAGRDLANRESQEFGPEAIDPDFLDRRGDRENQFGVLGTLVAELDDPNRDDDVSDSFVNQFLLPMLGVPDKIGELRGGVQNFLEELEQQVLEPTRQLLGDLNPFDPLIDFIKEQIQEYIFDVVRDLVLERFGLDIEVLDLLTANPSAYLDLASIDLGFGEIPLFQSTDRETLDAYLGFEGTDHLQPLGALFPGAQPGSEFSISFGEGRSAGLTFHPNAMAGLRDNAEFDPDRFDAFANMVEMDRLLLLQETLVNEAPEAGLQPKTISQLLSDLTGSPYDFELLELNGNHGGNLLTATLPGVTDAFGLPVSPFDIYELPIDGNLWLPSIDFDHTWRENSESSLSSLYRFHKVDTGASTVTWEFTNLPAGSYEVQVDWLINNELSEQGSVSPGRAVPYEVRVGNTLVATTLIDQLRFPDDVELAGTPGNVEPGGQNFEILATAVPVAAGTLRVVMSDADMGDGEFVVAGRVRVVPLGDTPGDAIVADNTGSAPNTSYTESVPELFTSMPLMGGEVAALDARTLPATLLGQFSAQGILFADAFEQARAAGNGIPLPADFSYADGLLDPSGLRVVVLDPGAEWLVVRLAKVNPGGSDRVVFGEQFRIVFDAGTNQFDVFQDWRGIVYRTGIGNFPLWESSLLRDDVFRTVFRDWENGPQNFPDLGDAASADPNETLGPAMEPVYGDFPVYVRFAPNLVAPADASGVDDLEIDGIAPIALSGDQTFANIVGNGDGTPDELTLMVDGTLTLTGFVGGRGLTNITIEATGGIILAPGATISSRQVAAGESHWDAASTADSGTLTLRAREIQVGEGANILAHADSGFADADVVLESMAFLDSVWSFLGIEQFRNIDTVASIDIAMDARLRGRDIRLDTSATTIKSADLDRDFSLPTTAVLLANVDMDAELELIVATLGQGILVYEFDPMTQSFDPDATQLEPLELQTRSIALGDVDDDGDLDLVAGNDGEADRFYRNDDGAFAAGVEIAVGDTFDTRAVALGNLDADDELELIVGADEQGIFRYEFDSVMGVFGMRSTVESEALDTRTLTLGDVDNSGTQDLVVGNRGQEDRFYANTGGVFDAAVMIGTDTFDTTSVVLANFDADAELELFVGTASSGLLRYDFDSGAFLPFVAIDAALENISSIALGDINNDGDTDLLAGVDGDRNIAYYGDGTGTLDAGRAASLDTDPTVSVALGQLDGADGVDLVTGNDLRPTRLYFSESVVGTTGYRIGSDVAIDAELRARGGMMEPIPINFDEAIAVVAESLAEVILGMGVYLDASNDVIVSATSTAEVDVTTIRSAWGVTLGRVSPTAIVFVDHGVEIAAVGDVNLTTQANSDLDVTTFVPSVGESFNISVSLATAEVESSATVRAGAVVDAANVNVLSRADNVYRNSAVAAGFGIGDDDETGLSATLALGFYQSEATADVGGVITTPGNLVIEGQSVNNTSATRSFASLDSGLSMESDNEDDDDGTPTGDIFDAYRALTDRELLFTQELGEQTDTNLSFRESEPEDIYALGLVAVTSDNVANALVGQDAFIAVTGDLTVESLAQDALQISASGTAGVNAPASELSVGGAIAYTKTVNRANTFVGWNATVDVRGSLDLDANAIRLAPVDPKELLLSIAGFGEASDLSQLGAIHAFGSAFSSEDMADRDQSLNQEVGEDVTNDLDRIFAENEVGNTYVHGSAAVGAEGMSVGGGINFLFSGNVANAGIAGGALINQRSDELFPTPGDTDLQDVSVASNAMAETVNYAGNPSVMASLADRGDTAVGGFFEGIFEENTSTAMIDDRAIVSAARNVEVVADTVTELVTIAVAGSFSLKTGVDGAIIYQRMRNETWAWIEDRATVTAGADVLVDAQSDVKSVAISPAVSIALSTGIGVGVAVSDIRDEVRAFIADSFEAVSLDGYGGVEGSVTAGSDIAVMAVSAPEVWSVAASAGVGIGGASETDNAMGPTQKFEVDPFAFAEVDTGSQADAGGDSGLGIAGSVSLNLVRQDTRAFISDRVTVVAGNALTVDAFANPFLISGAGAFAFGNDSFAIGASFAQNNLDQGILAFASNASITAESVAIHARTDNTVLGIAASGAGALDDTGVAGGVTLNNLDQEVDAFVGAGALILSPDVLIQAENQTLLLPIAGVVSVGTDLSVGVNVPLAFVDVRVDASVREGAQVTSTGDVRVHAANDTEVVSLGASLVLSSDSTAIGGAAIFLEFDHEVDAHVNGVIDADGSLFIDAFDATRLIAVAGQAAGGEDAGIGISAAAVLIDRSVRASIRGGARVDARGNGAGLFDPRGNGYGGVGVTLNAEADDTLFVFSVGGAVGESAAIVGSGAGTLIEGSVEAFIQDSEVNLDQAGAVAAQDVRVNAIHDVDQLVVGGSVAIAETVGVGIAAAVQVVNKDVVASIDSDADVRAAQDVNVTATSTGDFDVLAVGVSLALETDDNEGGLTFAGAGSATFTDFDSDVTAIVRAGANVETGRDVNIFAAEDAQIRSDAGVAAIAIAAGDNGGSAVAVAASVAINLVDGDTRAVVQGASVIAERDLVIRADSSPLVEALTGAGAVPSSGNSDGAISFGGAGAGSFNRVTTEAEVAVVNGATGVANTGTVTLNAIDGSSVIAIAGGVALTFASGEGATQVGVGASIAFNEIATQTLVLIDDSMVTAAGAISATAQSMASIRALTVAGAAGVSGGEGGGIVISFSGTGSANELDNDIATVVSGGATVESIGDTVTLQAIDAATIDAAAGAASFSLAGGDDGGTAVGVGLSFTFNDVANTTQVWIDDSTVTALGAVIVLAESNPAIRALSVSGVAGVGLGDGGGLSLNGASSGSVNRIENQVIARVSNGADLRSTGSTVDMTARDGSSITAASGTVALSVADGNDTSGAFGGGISFAVNDIGSDVTLALDAASVTAADALTLSAESNPEIMALTIAGTGSFGSADEGSALALSLAGAGSINRIDNKVQARVINGARAESTGDSVALQALDDSSISAAAGAVSLSLAISQNSNALVLGLGGSFAFNDIANEVTAIVDGADLVAATDVTIGAAATSDITALSVSGTAGSAVGESTAFSFQGAAAVTHNEIANTVQARVTGGTNLALGDTQQVSLLASDASVITAASGAAAVSVAVGDSTAVALGVGASFAMNSIGNIVLAKLDGGSTLSAGTVEIAATSSGAIASLSVAAAVAGGESEMGGFAVSGAGAVADNQVANRTEAVITEASRIDAAGAATLSAMDASRIEAGAGAVALFLAVGDGGAGAAGFGVSFAVNDVRSITRASAIGGSTITSVGALTLSAQAASTITSASVAGSVGGAGGDGGGLAIGLTGAGSRNAIENVVEVLAAEDAILQSGATLVLTALDASTINAGTGAGALVIAAGSDGSAAAGLGVSFAVNEIANTVRANADGAELLAVDSLILSADSNATIRTRSVAGTAAGAGGDGAAVTLAAAGAVSVNDVANTVEAIAQGGATLESTAGAVDLVALDRSLIDARAGSAALTLALGTDFAVGIGVGVAWADNRIANDVRAVVDGAEILDAASIGITATAISTISTASIVGALAVGVSDEASIAFAAAGAGARNLVDNRVEALLRNGAVVSTSGAFTVTATDSSAIEALVAAGSGSVAVGSVGIGFAGAGAVSLNTIGSDLARGNVTRAAIEGARVASAASVDVMANSSATIEAINASVSGSVAAGELGLSIAAAGALAFNSIESQTEAVIRASDVRSLGDVSVTASDAATILADAVVASVAVGVGGVGISVSLGLAYAENRIANDTLALVEDAQVIADGAVSVTSDSTADIDSLAAGVSIGVAAGAVAVNVVAVGGVTLNTVENTVEAMIRSTGDIAGEALIAGGDVIVGAMDASVITANTVAASLGLAAGSVAVSVNFTVSASSNEIANTVRAVIEDSTIDAGGMVGITAMSMADIDASAAAASLNVAAGVVAVVVGVVGAVTLNDIDNVVEAGISNSNVSAIGDVSIAATDVSVIRADTDAGAVIVAAGVVAISLSFALAGSSNEIANTTYAFIDDSDVVSTLGGVSVLADSSAVIEADVLAASISIAAGFVAVTGSLIGGVTLNDVGNDTQAVIRDSTITTELDVVVRASDSASMTSELLGVAASFGAGFVGIGLSVAINVSLHDIENSTLAIIERSAVVANTGGITVKAEANQFSDIDSQGVAAALGAGLVGIGSANVGAIANAEIDNTVEALVRDNVRDDRGDNGLRAGGSIEVLASDTSIIVSEADAGSISVGAGLVGIAISLSVAVSENEIDSVLRASIQDSEVESTGAEVVVRADSSATISAQPEAFSAAVAGGLVSVAGAGSGVAALNTVTNTIEAFIDQSIVLGTSAMGDGVSVMALDQSLIDSTTEGQSAAFAGASVAVGIAFTENNIENTIRAYITNSDVGAADGDVRIRAEADQTLRISAQAASVSLTGAISGAVAFVAIDSNIDAFVRDASFDAALGGVFVEADSDLSIFVDAQAFAASLVGLSAVIAEAEIGGSTRAYAEGVLNVTAIDFGVSANSVSFADADTQSEGVGLVGGAGAFTAAEVTRSTEARIGKSIDSAIPSTANVTASGAVTVRADSASDARTEASGGASGALGIVVFLSEANVGANTLAYVAEGTTISAAQLDVIADGTQEALARVFPETFTLAAGLLDEASATSSGRVEAFIGAVASRSTDPDAALMIDVTGAVNVAVDGSIRADAIVFADGFSGFAASGLSADATASGVARAYVRENVDLTADALTVSAGTAADRIGIDSGSNVILEIFSAIGLNEVESEARTLSVVEAFIGAPTGQIPTPVPGNLINVANGVRVESFSRLGSDATIQGSGFTGITSGASTSGFGGGALVGLSLFEVEATLAGTTRAFVSDAVDLRAGDLRVEADADTRMFTFDGGEGVSLLSGAFTTNRAIETHVVDAFIGPETGSISAGTATTVQTTGTVDVRALIDSRVTASSDHGGLSLFGAGSVTRTEAISTPTVRAYLGDGVNIAAAADVSLAATAQAEADALGQGASTGAGLAYGGARVISILEPVVQTFTEGSVSIQADDFSLVSSLNRNEFGDDTNGAFADVFLESGSLLVGIAGATVDVRIAPTLETRVGVATVIDATGAVTLTSTAFSLAEADADSISFGGFGIGVGTIDSDASSLGRFETYFDGTLQSADSVAILSEVDARGQAVGRAGGAAGAGLNDTDLDVLTAPAVSSWVGSAATLDATNNVEVSSLVTSDATLIANSSQFSAMATLGRVDVDATAAPDVDSEIRSGAVVNSALGGVFVRANHNLDPTTGLFLEDLGAKASTDVEQFSAGASIGTADLDALAGAAVTAQIAEGATIVASQGVVGVEARSSNLAFATHDSSSGATINLQSGAPNARSAGTTEARLLGEVSDAGGVGAASVLVSADGSDRAIAGIDTSGGGFVQVGLAGASAESTPVIRAELGGTIRASGSVTAQSFGNTDADTASRGRSGGFVSIGNISGSARISPNVETSVATGADIVAGTTLTLRADHGQQSATFSDGNFDAGTAVDPAADTIVLADPHGLVTGDAVTYEAGGNTAIGGLADGRPHRVIVEDDNTLKFGATFSSFDPFDPLNVQFVSGFSDVVRITVPHGLEDGDLLLYRTFGGLPIGGLVDGQVYAVVVTGIVSNTVNIALADPDDPTAAVINLTSSGSPSQQFFRNLLDVESDVVSFPVAHNFQNGDEVRYEPQGGDPIGGLVAGQRYGVRVVDALTIKLVDLGGGGGDQSFAGNDVDSDTDRIFAGGHGLADGQAVSYVAPTSIAFNVAVIDGGADRILLEAGHGLSTGDEVVYTASGTPIGGLVSGVSYFVIVDGAQPDSIQLAATLEEATGDMQTPIEPIDLSPSTDPADRLAPHSLRGAGAEPIGGLVPGVTYYVAGSTADDFQLATDPDGTNLVDLVATLGGVHQLLSGTIDFTGPGSALTTQLTLDITSTGSGMQRLVGVGGARAVLGAPSGDGIVTSSAASTSGGFVNVSEADSSAASAPVVETLVGSGATLSAFDIAIEASSTSGSAAAAADSGLGLVTVGGAGASVFVVNSSRVEIGSAAVLMAQNDVEIRSNTIQAVGVLSDIQGLGLVSVTGGDASANLDFLSEVAIGDLVSITAGGELLAESRSASSAAAGSGAGGAGLVAGSSAFALAQIGGALGASTRTSVGAGTRLEGRDVRLNAVVDSLTARAEARAEADGIGADVEAVAVVAVFDSTEVLLDTGAVIVGETVELVSRHDNVDVSTRSDADCDCLGGDTDSTASTSYGSTADVVAAVGARVEAQDLLVSAVQNVTRYDRRATGSGGLIDFGSDSERGFFGAGREIDWNADLVLASGPTPELVIDATGTVSLAVGVTVNGGQGTGADVSGGPISVDDIANTNANTGSALFEANGVPGMDGEPAPAGIITGAGGTLTLGSGFESVKLTNRSDQDLVVNDIDAENATAAAMLDLEADTVVLTFSESTDLGTPDVTIRNEGASDIVLQGFIENRSGTTNIVNTQGDILGSGFEGFSGGVVRTDTLDLTATMGGVGSATDFMVIRLGAGVGLLRASARDAIFLQAIGGDLRLDSVVSAENDVALSVLLGSIVDGNDDPSPDISGRSIDLVVFGGGIGAVGNALGIDVDNGEGGIGRLFAQASAGVYVTELTGPLAVLSATSSNGDVSLDVADSATSGDDLRLMVIGGPTLTGDLVIGGQIIAAGSVALSAGDDLTLPPGTVVQAGMTLTLRADDAVSDPDPGTGGNITINGELDAPNIAISGGVDTDLLLLSGTAGSDSFEVDADSVSVGGRIFGYADIENLRLEGRAGDDSFLLNDSSADTLLLDGEAGSDTYTAIAGPSTVQAQVADTGPLPPGDGSEVDTLLAPAGTLVGIGELFVAGQTVGYDRVSLEQLDVGGVLPGDANADGVVDGADYTIWADLFGGVGGSPDLGDLDSDGDIDRDDFDLWLANLGLVLPAVSGVSAAAEPGGNSAQPLAGVVPVEATRSGANSSPTTTATTASTSTVSNTSFAAMFESGIGLQQRVDLNGPSEPATALRSETNVEGGARELRVEIPPSVARSARIGEGVSLGEGTRVLAVASVGEGTTIGAHSVIGEGASIGARVRIGDFVTVEPFATIPDDAIVIKAATVRAAKVRESAIDARRATPRDRLERLLAPLREDRENEIAPWRHRGEHALNGEI